MLETFLGKYRSFYRLNSATHSLDPLPPPIHLSYSHYRPTRLSSGHISFISDMSQPSSSSAFQDLFKAALQDYENQTKTKLVQHPLAKKLEACNSVDSITAILQEQAQVFGGFRRDDGKIMKSLRSSVDVLYTLSNSTILGEVVGLVVHTTLLIALFSS